MATPQTLLLDRIKRYAGAVTVTIAFLTSCYKFAQLLSGDRTAQTVVVAGCGVVVLLLSCLAIYFGRNRETSTYLFPGAWRRSALALLVATPAAATLVLLYQLWRGNIPESSLVIVVAPFTATGSAETHNDTRIREIISTELQPMQSEYGDIVVRTVDTPLSSEADQNGVAKRLHATVLLYGSYVTTEGGKIIPLMNIRLYPTRSLQAELDRPLPVETHIARDQLPSPTWVTTMSARLDANLRYLALLLSGVSHYARGDFNGSFERLSDAKRYRDATTSATLVPDPLDHYLGLAAAQTAHYNEAIASLIRALKVDPGDAAAAFSLATQYRETKNLKAATATYRTLERTRSGDRTVYLREGSMFEDLTRWLDAKAVYRRGLSHLRDDTALKLRLAFTLRQLKQLPQAVAQYNTIRDLRGLSPLQLADMASTYKAAGDRRYGSIYAGLLSSSPTTADEYVARAEAKADHHEVQPAIDDYSKAIEISGGRFAYMYDNRGVVYRDDYSLKLAIADFTSALALDPSDSFAYRHRADAHAHNGNRVASLNDIRRALQISPGDPAVHAEACSVYNILGKDAAARKECKATLSVDPSNASAYVTLSQIEPNIKRSVAYARKAYEIDPYDVAVLEQYGAALAADGQRSGLRYFDEAVSLDPQSRYIPMHRAMAKRVLHDYSGALADLDLAERNGWYGRLSAERAHVYHDLKRYADERKEYQREYDVYHGWETLDSIGETYFSEGQYDDALSYFQQSRAAKPDEPVPYFDVARALAKLRRTTEARTTAQDAVNRLHAVHDSKEPAARQLLKSLGGS